MMKLTAAVALIGALALAPAVMAAEQGGSSSATVNTPSQSVTTDLNNLIQADLQTVANLRADLPALRHKHGATFVWLIMIQDRNYAANRLATEIKKAGGTPVMTIPAAQTTNAKADDLIAIRLQTSERLLKTIQSSEDHDGSAAKDTLKQIEAKIHSHVNFLMCLKKGYPITGA